MSLFRAGLLLLTLLLSACSSPYFYNTPFYKGEQSTQTENEQPEVSTKERTTKTNDTDATTSNTHIKSEAASTSDNSQIERKESQEKLGKLLIAAKTLHTDLKVRTGDAQPEPTINIDQLDSNKALENAIQKLRSYNNKLTDQLATLNDKVEKRRAAPQKGDLLKIFIHKADIKLANSNFTTQPLIGQWVRGESRVIRLKDSILFDTKHSEDIKITYSDNYQVLVNNQVISIVNPNKEKNTAPFNVSTSEKDGNIKGELDYSIVKGDQ